MDKLEQVIQYVDRNRIMEDLRQIQELERNISQLDEKIKVIYNRCQNELKPRLKAMKHGEDSMKDKFDRGQKTISELNEYIGDIDKEID